MPYPHSARRQDFARRAAGSREAEGDHSAADVRNPVQAAVGSKVFARETVKGSERSSLPMLRRRFSAEEAARKAECGMKKMRKLGSVDGPSEACMAVLKLTSRKGSAFEASGVYIHFQGCEN